MEIVVAGVSHKTAPLEIRERLAVPGDQIPGRLAEITQLPAVREAVMLSTCNRVEVYAAVEDPDVAIRAVDGSLRGWSQADLTNHLYVFAGTEAVEHIFRVASSLDSMVVGEPQILGQVKDAFSVAAEAGATGPVLSRCFHRAFQVAKRVRSETGIARSAVSVSSIAVELARTIFENLRDKQVLLLGAGEMAELTARHMASAGAHRIVVANRSLERAQRVASEVGGQARNLEQIGALLEIADIVICSTSSATFVVPLDEGKRVLKARRYRPLFFIDLAVPRDVDPRVGELDSVYLYDIDDLQQVAERHRAERRGEAEEAEGIVGKESAQFMRWLRSLEVVPTVVALREKCVSIARAEAARTLGHLGPLDDSQREAIERLAESIVNKILHAPLTQLKRDGASGGAEMVALVQRLFELEIERAEPQPEPPRETAEAKES